MAEAELQPNELQDLADEMGNLLGLIAGLDISFRLRIELDHQSPQDVVNRVNNALMEINPRLKLE